MVAALLFWALALYGALTLVWQSVQHIRHKQYPKSVTFVLVVENAESQIEGVLRTMLLKFSMTRRDHRIVVLDLGTGDATQQIVHNLARRYDGFEYQSIRDETEVSQYVARACLDSKSLWCIVDLRVPDMVREISQDVAWLCH